MPLRISATLTLCGRARRGRGAMLSEPKVRLWTTPERAGPGSHIVCTSGASRVGPIRTSQVNGCRRLGEGLGMLSKILEPWDSKWRSAPLRRYGSSSFLEKLKRIGVVLEPSSAPHMRLFCERITTRSPPSLASLANVESTYALFSTGPANKARPVVRRKAFSDLLQ
jgi:hypothetical protein